MSMQQIFQMMRDPKIISLMNSKNPNQIAIDIIKNSPKANTEIGKNVIQMLERGNPSEIEQYGKNIAQSQGMNVNEIMSNFKNAK